MLCEEKNENKGEAVQSCFDEASRAPRPAFLPPPVSRRLHPSFPRSECLCAMRASIRGPSKYCQTPCVSPCGFALPGDPTPAEGGSAPQGERGIPYSTCAKIRPAQHNRQGLEMSAKIVLIFK